MKQEDKVIEKVNIDGQNNVEVEKGFYPALPPYSSEELDQVEEVVEGLHHQGEEGVEQLDQVKDGGKFCFGKVLESYFLMFATFQIQAKIKQNEALEVIRTTRPGTISLMSLQASSKSTTEGVDYGKISPSR